MIRTVLVLEFRSRPSSCSFGKYHSTEHSWGTSAVKPFMRDAPLWRFHLEALLSFEVLSKVKMILFKVGLFYGTNQTLSFSMWWVMPCSSEWGASGIHLESAVKADFFQPLSLILKRAEFGLTDDSWIMKKEWQPSRARAFQSEHSMFLTVLILFPVPLIRLSQIVL